MQFIQLIAREPAPLKVPGLHVIANLAPDFLKHFLASHALPPRAILAAETAEHNGDKEAKPSLFEDIPLAFRHTGLHRIMGCIDRPGSAVLFVRDRTEEGPMPTSRRVQRKLTSEHTFSSFRVKSFDAGSRASINHQVASPKYSFEPLLPEDLVFSHITSLTVRGETAYPPERASFRYELTTNGEDGRYKRVNLTLGDIQSQNKHGSPIYREYRGRTIPVVDPVPGIALLDKNKQGVWTAWINVLPRLVSDMMAILNTNRPIWISLHEAKIGRSRWIRDISIQTTNPEEE